MATKTVQCEFCGKTMPNDPGFYYHHKACEATHVRQLIKEAEERGAPADEMRRLRSRLELANYVGD